MRHTKLLLQSRLLNTIWSIQKSFLYSFSQVIEGENLFFVSNPNAMMNCFFPSKLYWLLLCMFFLFTIVGNYTVVMLLCIYFLTMISGSSLAFMFLCMFSYRDCRQMLFRYLTLCFETMIAGSYLVVMLPGYFVHLLNVSPTFEPCHHLLLHGKLSLDRNSCCCLALWYTNKCFRKFCTYFLFGLQDSEYFNSWPCNPE